MSYNIAGYSLVIPENKKGVIDVINNNKPDIIGLQEVDSLWYRCKSPVHDVTKDFAKACSMYGYFAADRYQTEQSLEKVATACSLPRDSFPNYIGSGYGNATLSKNKPLSATKIMLPHKETELGGNEVTLQILEYEDYVFFNTHLIYDDRNYRILQAQEITKIAKKYHKPIFLVGDMNALPHWQGDAIQILLQDWEVINDLLDYTFPAKNPTKAVDFIFYYKNPNYCISVNHVEVINEAFASDHRPVFAEVVITKDLEVKDQVISNDKKFNGCNIHISNTQIQDNAVVSFNSTKSIVISPNFIAKNGTTVRFSIKPPAIKNITNNRISSYDDIQKREIQNIREEKIECNKIFMYPNPTNGILNVELSDLKGECQIKIYNLSGKLIYSNDILKNGDVIDLSLQPKGMYLAKIILNGESITQKIMLK